MFFDNSLRANALEQGRHAAGACLRRSTITGWVLAGTLVLAMAGHGTAHAAPAPWYWWISKVDGQRVCAQHMPAQGWERDAGPFAQAGCKAR